jgi:hypothetical protein
MCQIGTGTINGTVTVGVNEYLVPAAAPTADVAGIDFLSNPGGVLVAHAELALKQYTSGPANGQVYGQITLPFASPGVTSIVSNINGTVNGQPFTRMPSSCTLPAPSSILVSYSGGSPETSNASPDVDVHTTCGGLSFAPAFSGSGVKDSSDQGVRVTTDLTQGAAEASIRQASLTTPASTLQPNLAAASGLLNHAVGSASASSPLLPAPLTGTVFLRGTLFAPILSVEFPAPEQFTLAGAINIATNAVNFAALPDVPLTDLHVVLNGGSNALFISNCNPPSGPLTGSFTGQNTAMHTSSSTFGISGCAAAAGKPTATGSFKGLRNGKPKLKLTITHGNNAPGIKSFSIKLPGGLSFKCKVKKNKCKGLSVSDKVTSLKVSGNKLVIKLKSAAASVSVTAAGPLLKETNALKNKVRKKKVKNLSVNLNLTDANGTTTAIKLKLAAK